MSKTKTPDSGSSHGSADTAGQGASVRAGACWGRRPPLAGCRGTTPEPVTPEQRGPGAPKGACTQVHPERFAEARGGASPPASCLVLQTSRQ